MATTKKPWSEKGFMETTPARMSGDEGPARRDFWGGWGERVGRSRYSKGRHEGERVGSGRNTITGPCGMKGVRGTGSTRAKDSGEGDIKN